ncbi:uncharacterized protein LOC113122387 isoform X3 [Mastacembelus armatus]|uniref:uncharacterized protein LOC113122387 isoform X3 n=1 Tax=Mastacembelus armatus TaxID=205130 RepID=UPI000E457F44|nr:uncharacterized protein LOC113122387 isoform X3 [Mastacembelus armatus]
MDSPSVIRTMMNFILITASILCSLSWISVSAAESQTVKVQPGEEVNLLCPNMSKYDDLTFWFRLVNGTKMGCISVMYKTTHSVSYCNGFQSGTFEMSSNISTVSLKIKQVDLSDSGLYFCGVYTGGLMLFNTVHLNVKGSVGLHEADSKCRTESDGTSKLISVILGGVTVSLVVLIIGLTVKNRKLQRANEEETVEQSENHNTDELNYTTVKFRPKPK